MEPSLPYLACDAVDTDRQECRSKIPRSRLRHANYLIVSLAAAVAVCGVLATAVTCSAWIVSRDMESAYDMVNFDASQGRAGFKDSSGHGREHKRLLASPYLRPQSNTTAVQFLAGDSSPERTVCLRHTGGTCFFLNCRLDRNAICKRDWATLQWHSCACGEGQCAINGICTDHPEPYTTTGWLRGELYTSIFMIIILVGRSGFDGWIFGLTGLDRLTSAHKKIKLSYNPKTAFDVARRQQSLSENQAVFVCAVKFVFWHLAQVIFIWVSWYAFKHMMGWAQYVLAFIIAVRELYYLFLLVLGVSVAPQYLLFAPFSEESIEWRVVYFVSPECFVGDIVHASTSLDIDTLGTLSNLLSICAWPALFVGFHDGVMFPALFLGYFLCGVSPIGARTMGEPWRPPNSVLFSTDEELFEREWGIPMRP